MEKLFLGLMLTGILFIAGCTQANMKNPASEYCVKNGGTLKIVNENGGQVGYCHLSDGRVCEEWSYYRGHCKMPMEEAYKIAKSASVCNSGNVSLQTTEGEYNKNTYTWWFSLNYTGDMDCNPACVVYENGTADVNWRCMGLIPSNEE